MSFRNTPTHAWHNVFLYLYIVVLTLSGIIGGVAFCMTPKPDSIAVEFLAFLDGVGGIIYITIAQTEQEPSLLPQIVSEGQNNISPTGKDSAVRISSYTNSLDITPDSRQLKPRSCQYRTLRIGNRILMVLHSLLVLISVAGAIELAVAYQHTNP